MAMKLGDLLVRLGRITAAQRDEALRAQVLYGGRFGTNLIELTSIDLDDIAQALGRQHQHPAALQAHFEQSDPTLQAKLKRYLAARWECIPLARLADDTGRVAIAVCEPLPQHALEEIALALGTRAGSLIVGLAAELRIRYHLERVYGIDREARFLRVRGGRLPEVPALGDLGVDDEVELDDADLLAPEPEPEPTPPAPVPHAPAPLASPDRPRVPSVPPPLGDERRRYLQTIDEAARAPQPAPAPVVAESSPQIPIAAPQAAPQAALGRLAIKRVAVGPGGVIAAGAGDAGPARAATLPEALRELRRGRDRDRVGDLMVEALRGFADASIDAALVLVVRGDVALGWKGFVKGGEVDVPALALPLGERGLLADVRTAAAPRRVDLSKQPLAGIDRQLADVLGGPAPSYVVAAPTVLAEQVVCLVYAQGHGAMGLAAEVVDGVASSAGAAFARLMRAAQR